MPYTVQIFSCPSLSQSPPCLHGSRLQSLLWVCGASCGPSNCHIPEIVIYLHPVLSSSSDFPYLHSAFTWFRRLAWWSDPGFKPQGLRAYLLFIFCYYDRHNCLPSMITEHRGSKAASGTLSLGFQKQSLLSAFCSRNLNS